MRHEVQQKPKFLSVGTIRNKTMNQQSDLKD